MNERPEGLGSNVVLILHREAERADPMLSKLASISRKRRVIWCADFRSDACGSTDVAAS